MYVYTEGGTLVNLDNVKHLTVKPYTNSTYAVVADDSMFLCRKDSADEAYELIADLAYDIEHCKRVCFIGEIPVSF